MSFPKLAVLTFALFVSSLAQTAEAQNRFRAVSTGDQEVTPVQTDAIAFSRYTFVGGGNLLISSRVEIGLSGPLIPVAGLPSGAHLHNAPAGENGPVVVVFDNSPDINLGFIRFSFDFVRASDLLGPLEGGPLADLRAEMAAGAIYLNLHTDENPTGEIRGQLEAL